MNVTGIIAEYNPFHKGHQFHIQASKQQTSSDYVIVVISGNFLQRGTAACLDKFHRTKMALLQGADLVLELPLPFATASAPDFARGSIEILNATGVTTHLSFGSEWGSLKELEWLASFFTEEPDAYKEMLAQKLKSGVSYPKARAEAFQEYLCKFSDFSSLETQTFYEILNNPNNILSIAYLRSLKQTASTIKPITLERKGAGYHEVSLNKGFASATAIRNLLSCCPWTKDTWLQLQKQLPDTTYTILKNHLEQFPVLDNNSFSSQLYYKLLTCTKEDFMAFAGVPLPLADRIQKELSSYQNFTGFTMSLKRKNDSFTSLSRALLHILLNIMPEDLINIPYLRILGFKKESTPLLHEIKKNATLPLLTKAADAKFIFDKTALALFEKELFSERIYHSAYQNTPHYTPYDPYKNTPVIL